MNTTENGSKIIGKTAEKRAPESSGDALKTKTLKTQNQTAQEVAKMEITTKNHYFNTVIELMEIYSLEKIEGIIDGLTMAGKLLLNESLYLSDLAWKVKNAQQKAKAKQNKQEQPEIQLFETSIQNLEIAERVGIFKSNNAFLIWVEKKGMRAFLHGTESILMFKTEAEAETFAKKCRPDLNPILEIYTETVS